MKCPSCNSSCSDLRDICPQCLLDLRPQKEILKIQISNPTASYDDLLKKVSRPKANDSSKAAPAKLLNGLMRFFGSKTENTLAPAKESKPEATKRKNSRTNIVRIPLSAQARPQTPISINPATDTKIIIDEKIDRIDLETYHTGPQDSSVKSSDGSFSATLDISDFNPSAFSPSHSTEINSGGMQELVSFEAPLLVASENISELQHSKPASEPVKTEELLLFLQIEQEIESFRTDSDFELTFGQFYHNHNPEEIEVLFQIAQKSIEDPNSLVGIVEKITTSEQVQVTADELSRTLKETEKVIDTPFLSLKNTNSQLIEKLRGSLQEAAETDRTAASPLKKARTAGFVRRLTCGLIDLTGTLILSVVTAATVCFFLTPELFDSIFTIDQLQFYETLPIISLFIVSFSISLFSYPLIILMLFERTPGQFCSATKVVKENYKKTTFRNILVRSLIFPLSFICGGCLPLLFKKRPLHDYLSKTRVIRLS